MERGKNERGVIEMVDTETLDLLIGGASLIVDNWSWIRPGRLPKVSDNAIDWERYIENQKSSVRCKVEHPYRIVKNIFGFQKAVYRGLRKNLNRLHVLFTSANLYMLARTGGSLSPA